MQQALVCSIQALYHARCVSLASRPRVRSAGFAGHSSLVPVYLAFSISRPLGGVRWSSPCACALVFSVCAASQHACMCCAIIFSCVSCHCSIAQRLLCHSRALASRPLVGVRWGFSSCIPVRLDLPTSRPLGRVRWSLALRPLGGVR